MTDQSTPRPGGTPPEPLSKGDEARADILDAAQRLFLRQGFHGTSMRAIARAAGDRAVAGLYNHFPTKDAIFEALIEERNPYEQLFGTLEAALDGVTSGPEFVHRALRAVIEVMPQHVDFIQLAQIDFREFGARNMRQVLTGDVIPRALGLIARLETLPGMKPLNTFAWLRLMGSIVIGFMITEQIAENTPFGMYSRDEWADLFADALLYGIAAPPDRAPHGVPDSVSDGDESQEN